MDMDVDRVVCCGDRGNDILTAAALMRISLDRRIS